MTTNVNTYIIAEAGVNHNGSLDLAYKLIDAALYCGADAVKFQTFKTEHLVTRHAPKASYQIKNSGSSSHQYDMLKELEFSDTCWLKIIGYANERGMKILSTPFDGDSLKFLVSVACLSEIKVSSGDLTNAPFLLEIAKSAESIILSSGMSSLSEIETALGVIAYGFISDAASTPSKSSFEAAYYSKLGQEVLRKRVSLLHCTTEYPAQVDEVNLSVINTLKSAFGLEIGLSDHTRGKHIAVAAVALGARIIEKHFTLDCNLPGPDHCASLEPHEFKDMVSSIRDVERALGTGIKIPFPSELNNRTSVRKSLVSSTPLRKGETIVPVCKRPGNGVSPYKFWEYINRPANRDYNTDEQLDEF